MLCSLTQLHWFLLDSETIQRLAKSGIGFSQWGPLREGLPEIIQSIRDTDLYVVMCKRRRVDASPSLALALQLALQASTAHGVVATYVTRNRRMLATVCATAPTFGA
jgi:hypothetical protein